MNEVERKAAMDRVALGDIGGGRGGRRYPRITLPAEITMHALIQHPGGGELEVRAVLRDISRGGYGMFHGGYLHVGTKVISTFVGPDGAAMISHPGRVVRCVHIQGSVHEVGVEFEGELALESLIGAEDAAGATKAEFFAEIEQLTDEVMRAVRARDKAEVIRTKVERLAKRAGVGENQAQPEKPAKPSEGDLAA